MKFFQSSRDADATTSYLIVGLGNPGREYRLNRHNVGFMLLDRLAQQLGTSFARVQSKSLIAKADYEGRRLILVKPQMYMNLSGQAVAALLRFYKIPVEQSLVAGDDIDLPLGTLRMRPAGGSAGQKGMQSVIEKLGTQDFPRLRIGIGRPPGRRKAADYVLHDFSKDEIELLAGVFERGVEAALVFVRDGLDAAMNQYNAQVFKDPN